MSTTNNVNNPQALLDSLGLSRPTKPNAQGSSVLGSGDFMKLMLAQLQHQDPTNPTDSTQYLTQIAQMSTVTGIQDVNASVSGLTSSLQASFQSNQALQASSMVGRTVLTPGSNGVIGGGNTTINGTVELPSSSPNVMVGVYNSAGALVRTLNLGTQAAGNAAFSWDGKDQSGTVMKDGVYSVKAAAYIDGTETALNTNIYSQVQSVDLGGTQGIRLNLAGLGSAKLSDIKQIK